MLHWQGTLLGTSSPAADGSFADVRRTALGHGAWVDHAPAWVTEANELMASLLADVPWQERIVRMYDRSLPQPRLTAALPEGVRPAVVESMRRALSHLYAVELTGVGANLYRDGRDSVAWHGDRVARDLPTALVAIVSLGGARRFLLRPKGGGRSVRFDLSAGDLLVMGGSCQRTWQHSLPKAARAEARISITFRHAYR